LGSELRTKINLRALSDAFREGGEARLAAFVTLRKGIHAPMISKKTFDEIQAALVSVGKPCKKTGRKGISLSEFRHLCHLRALHHRRTTHQEEWSPVWLDCAKERSGAAIG
jgi:hypothetical protein